MNKQKIKIVLLTIVLSTFCIIPIINFKILKVSSPMELYRVYLNGSAIGVIESKDKLQNYINEEQTELRNKYNVEKVYAPTSLYISEYKSYNSNVSSEEEIYKIIQNKEDFTIKGYEITIKKDEEDIVFYVLKKEDFEDAMTSVVKAFVDEDDLDVFMSGEEVVIESTGKKIEDLYIKEEIRIKETYIPSSKEILQDAKEITKYLLFGSEIEEKYYTVRAGDTIESIALDNRLAVEELLVVNENLRSKNNILSIGEEVSVALISPIITVVEEEHSVEEKEIPYTTHVEYDSSKYYGYTEIKQEGKNGLQIVTQKIKYENGEIVNALIAETEVITEVINSVKIVGTKSAASINPTDLPDIGDWYWPTLQTYIITSHYGYRWGSLHDGTDISGTGHGSPIYAANNGVVVKVWYDGIGGNQILIAHQNDIYTWYAHLSSSSATLGQEVNRGDYIGAMGCTGSACTGTHLHFAMYKGRPAQGGVSFNICNSYYSGWC